MHVHPVTGLAACHIRNLAFKLDLSKVQQKNFAGLLGSLYELFHGERRLAGGDQSR